MEGFEECVQQFGPANGSQPLSLQDKSKIIGGRLPSLTFALDFNAASTSKYAHRQSRVAR
jgi:hypothetical protein